MDRSVKTFFESCYATAISAADPMMAIKAHVPPPPKGRLIVVGAGKGAAQLAQAFEHHYTGNIEGLVVTRYGFGAPCEQIEVIEAAHPVPDENSRISAQRLLQHVSGLTNEDLVVALITGGGSALLAAPLAPMTLDDEIVLNTALLRSGRPISEMNTVRRHVSAIKGGRLAEAAKPARVLSLIVSDVPGDDPSEVASGPTVAGQSTPEDALRLIKTHGLALPEAVITALLSAQARGPEPYGEAHIIASARQSLNAVESFAKACEFHVCNLGDAVEGEAREVAKAHAELAREAKAGTLLISGGETTVTVSGAGKGGRNTEYLLALAIALEGIQFEAFAADTDGIDGSETNAGAFANGSTCARLRALGHAPENFLSNNDAYTAFALLGDLFTPGPSGTNVNDLRLVLITGQSLDQLGFRAAVT